MADSADVRSRMMGQFLTRERARAAGIDLDALLNQEIVRRSSPPVVPRPPRRSFTWRDACVMAAAVAAVLSALASVVALL